MGGREADVFGELWTLLLLVEEEDRSRGSSAFFFGLIVDRRRETGVGSSASLAVKGATASLTASSILWTPYALSRSL